MDVVELFERGGPLMWAILAACVIGVAFFIERLIALSRRKVLPPDAYERLIRTMNAGDAGRAEQLCRENNSVLCRVVEVGLRHRGQGRAMVKEAMEEAGQVEVSGLTAGVAVLSTVAAIAPLLGLLGTVTGMIQVFRDVASSTDPDISVLAGGIWQALITTGAGLTVAIPMYVAFRFVENRIDRHARELEEAALETLASMFPIDDPSEGEKQATT